MEQIGWQIVVLVVAGLIYHRVGQIVNPPLADEMKAMKKQFTKTEQRVAEMAQKYNAIMIKEGFRGES